MKDEHMVSVPITPIGKPRMTRRGKWSPAAKRYYQFCNDLREALPGYQLPGCLHIVCFLPMPASWSRKEREAMLGAPHTSRPDADNIAKSFMDAFKTDDSHVFDLHVEKYWGVEGSIELEGDILVPAEVKP